MRKDQNYYAYLEGWISIAVNILLFIIKYIAGLLSGSLALIADAWHTLSDSISSIAILIGTKISSKPADSGHPFGHGRAELISSIIVGVMLTIVALNFIIAAFDKFTDKQTVEYGTFAIIVTVISIFFKEGLAQFAFWTGRKANSKVLKADGWHHRSDAISSVVILAGIFLEKYFWWIDAVLAFIVSLLIFYVAYTILKDTVNTLLGEKPDIELIQKIKNICNQFALKDINAHHFHIHKYGKHTELTFHICLSNHTILEDAHKLTTQIAETIRKELNIEATIMIQSSK